MPPLLLGTFLFLLLCLLGAALGDRLIQILHGPHLHGAERGVWAIASGMGLLSYLPFLLFSLGIGKPAGMRLAVCVLTLLLLPDIKRVLRSGWRWVRSLRCWNPAHQALFALLLVLLFTFYLRALCPPFKGDAIDYHLSVLHFLQVGHFRYLPTMIYTNWPLGVQMLFALALGLHPNMPPAIVQFIFGLLLLALLYMTAEKFVRRGAGICVICLLILVDHFSQHGIWYQMMTPMVDLGLTLYMTCAVFAAYRSLAEPQSKTQWLLLSALFAGFAATTKLTGIWVILALTIVLFLAYYRNGSREAFRQASMYCLLAILVVLPWFVKTWILTGNPVYPILWERLGGIEWTASGWARFQRAHLEWNTPPGKLPTLQVLRAVHLQYALIGIGAGLILMYFAQRSRYAVIIQASVLFGVFICIGNYLHPRFLMPALPSILIYLTVPLRGRRVTAALLCLSALVVLLGSNWQWPPTLMEASRVAIGQTSIEDYMRAHVPEWDVVQYANHHLPDNARILLSGYEYKPALFHAEALWPDYALQDSIHYDSASRLDTDLQRLNVRYLLLNTQYPDWCETSHRCRERKAAELLPTISLAERHGQLLYQANNYRLYVLHF